MINHHIKPIADKLNKEQSKLKEILDQQAKVQREQDALRQQQAENLREINELARLSAQRETEREAEEAQQEIQEETVEENLAAEEIIYEQQEEQARIEIASKDVSVLQNSGASPAQIAAAAAVVSAVGQNQTSNPAAQAIYNQSSTTPPFGQNPTANVYRDQHDHDQNLNQPQVTIAPKQTSVTVYAVVKVPGQGYVPVDSYIKPEITAATIDSQTTSGQSASAVNYATVATQQPGLNQQPGLYIQPIHATPTS